MEATLTSKGQITLPKPLRDLLNLNAGDRIEFLLEKNGRIELIPVSASVTRLKGMVPRPAKPVSIDKMNAAIARRAGRG